MVNWKGVGRRWSWPNLEAISRYLLRKTEESHENLRIYEISGSHGGKDEI
jgi:hypothetical protein